MVIVLLGLIIRVRLTLVSKPMPVARDKRLTRSATKDYSAMLAKGRVVSGVINQSTNAACLTWRIRPALTLGNGFPTALFRRYVFNERFILSFLLLVEKDEAFKRNARVGRVARICRHLRVNVQDSKGHRDLNLRRMGVHRAMSGPVKGQAKDAMAVNIQRYLNLNVARQDGRARVLRRPTLLRISRLRATDVNRIMGTSGAAHQFRIQVNIHIAMRGRGHFTILTIATIRIRLGSAFQ